MTSLRDLVTRAKAESDFDLLAQAIPYARFLGVRVTQERGELIGRMDFADHLIGNAALPALHGGAIGALLETIATFQTLWEAESVVLPKIVTLTIDYLRSGRPVDTFASAAVSKQGRRVVTVSAEAWQEDRSRPIARAGAHFLVLT
jgi:acyl-coenzyme A thioesterase PaaI-like protein